MPATLLSCFLAPLVATAQSLVPASLRAFTSAILVLVVNIVGLGMGPLITGVISDILVSHYGYGRDSLRYAIAASAVGALWAAVHFLRAAHYVRQELAASSKRRARQRRLTHKLYRVRAEPHGSPRRRACAALTIGAGSK